jgi:hypothetical protein
VYPFDVDGGRAGPAGPHHPDGLRGRPEFTNRRSSRVSVPTVLAWRGKYQTRGLAGLDDEQRSGRTRGIDRRKIITATRPSRLLARHLKTDFSTEAKTWREYGVKPWKAETFKFSNDPELEAKVVDVVGLYLAPPENAVVLCIDEKSHIQALDRTAPLLPMQIGIPEKRTHDYVRHGTTTFGSPPWTLPRANSPASTSWLTPTRNS